MTRHASWLLVASLLFLAACSDSANKIGSTLKGDRVPAIQATHEIQPDSALKDSKPLLPPSVVTQSWPQAGYDTLHVLPALDAASSPHLLWRDSIGAGSGSDQKLLASPVAGRESIYAMDAKGVVSALDLETGHKKWTFDTTPKERDDPAMGGGLALDGPTLFATTGFGEVLAIDAGTGVLKWRKALLNPLRAAPTVAEGRVYALSIANDLNALDAETGEILWHQAGASESATLMGASSPAVIEDTVIAAYNSGEIFALRAQNGRALWNYMLAAPASVGALPAIADIRGLPVVDRGAVYAISHSGRIAAIDQRTGERLWESDIGGINTPVLAEDALFLYGGDHQLMALARVNGRVMWIRSLDKREKPEEPDSDPLVWTGPLLAHDRLWMVNSAGFLIAFSPDDGAPLERIELGSPAYLSPILVNKTLYILTDEGKLVALR